MGEFEVGVMVRRARELSPEQKTLVAGVKRVARQRARVNANYVAAILQAREAGVTYAAIAQAVGTSSQAVQEIVRRHRTGAELTEPEQMSGGAGVVGGIAAVAETTGGVVNLGGDALTTNEDDAVAL